jgi:hypothetical protein
MSRMRAPLCLLVACLCACSAPRVVGDLDSESPPPELGRPGWVRASAKIGAIAGAGIGGLAAIVLLPVSLPISWLADEPLGRSKEEFLFAPVSIGASTGHFLLGAPADGVHFVLVRAWQDEPPATSYAHTPVAPPLGPAAVDLVPASQPTAATSRTAPPAR